MSMLEIAGVSKTFTTKRGRMRRETRALDEISLSVREGEFLVIVGSSGCGKSTLLRMIDGLTAPTAGEIRLRGKVITAPGPDRGVVFQHAHLLPRRTVRRNVDFGLECMHLPTAERKQRTARYLSMVGLESFADHYPGQLSGGMQQRVGLARAFAVEPEILLLDEPFGALDAQTRLVMQTELERIWSLEKRTAILITHDIEEALFLADRIVVMTPRPGRVSQIVDVPFDRPRTDAVRADPVFARMKRELWDALKSGVEQP